VSLAACVIAIGASFPVGWRAAHLHPAEVLHAE